MAALDFPDAPTNGQVFDKWTWNGTQWVLTASGVGGVITHYNQALAASVALTTATQTLLTQPMPATPAGTLLDLSATIYHNHTVGAGAVFYSIEVNTVVKNPVIIVPDITQLATFTGRVVAVAPPAGIAYNITLRGVKSAAGGSANATTPHTNLSIVSYRP